MKKNKTSKKGGKLYNQSVQKREYERSSTHFNPAESGGVRRLRTLVHIAEKQLRIKAEYQGVVRGT